MTDEAYRLISPDGRELELPVHKGTTGPDLIDIGRIYREQGIFTYDPGFVATGSCKSDITFIDGEKGILMYRGYPVEQLAAHSNFLEVCYLLLHGDLPQSLQGDATRLSQVIVNLINNAIKFTAQGQVVVEASRRCDDAGEEQVEIVVKDTGIGLDAVEQERLFSPFAQGDSSITRRFGGTGLGLSIARRIVEEHGGKLWIEGRKEGGVTFVLSLPL